ncbi:hypothetical protein [Bradyrhizobium sp. BR 1433]|uniref:hypothetical protein n=1 Tax=Bradyrhizobium sp. BR 1433 TaxID=3447967 RepID=UPI003EE7D050
MLSRLLVFAVTRMRQSFNVTPSLAAAATVEATFRFKLRAIFSTGIFALAKPLSLYFSAAVHGRSPLSRDCSPAAVSRREPTAHPFS